jgi:hypothetical protein
MAAAILEGNPLAPNGHMVPTFASSAAGGVTAVTARTVGGSIGTYTSMHIHGFNVTITTAHAHGIVHSGSHGGHPHVPLQSAQTFGHGLSAALLDKVRQLDALPRLGALQTLDLKGSEIRVSRGCSTLLLYYAKAMAP